MDAKNIEALSYGPEHMLGKFANLPDKPGDARPAEAFQERFGVLFPGLAPKNYYVDVRQFRRAWHAKEPHQLESVGGYLTEVCNRIVRSHITPPAKAPLAADPRYYPAVEINFASGRIALTPHATLLDWLAKCLLECRHRLGQCEREGCGTPYFVKAHPRQKYCSEMCFRESRLEQKNQWWKKNRGKDAQRSPAKVSARNRRKRGRR